MSQIASINSSRSATGSWAASANNDSRVLIQVISTAAGNIQSFTPTVNRHAGLRPCESLMVSLAAASPARRPDRVAAGPSRHSPTFFQPALTAFLAAAFHRSPEVDSQTGFPYTYGDSEDIR